MARLILSLGTLVGLLSSLPLSGATILLLDFDNDGPNPFGFWNILGTPGSGLNNLISDEGETTGISVTSTGWNFGLGYSLDNWTTGDTDWVQDNAADDGWSVEDGIASITFSGLYALFEYRIEVVATSRFDGDVADYMVEGEFAPMTYTGTGASNGDDWDAKVDGNDAGNWLIWDSVTPDANGNITLVVNGLGSYGDVSAIRFIEIPEPSMAGLLGLALASALRRKRS